MAAEHRFAARQEELRVIAALQMGRGASIVMAILLALMISSCLQGKKADIGDLLSHPERYQGRKICTEGVYVSGFEASALGASTYQVRGTVYLAEPVIWIESADIRSRADCFKTQTTPPAEFCTVTVCGLFECGGEYGPTWEHMNVSYGEACMVAKAKVTKGISLLFLSILVLVGAACGTSPTPASTPFSAPFPTPTHSTPTDLESAREALTTYFSLLHAGRYSEAIEYYGGSYETLRVWNPDVHGDDYVTLFEQGCTANGLMCLQVGKIVDQEQVSPTDFTFVVEFVNDDGSLFVLGPCCGETEEDMPPQSQFTVAVKKVDHGFLVQDLPVYVP